MDVNISMHKVGLHVSMIAVQGDKSFVRAIVFVCDK